MKRFALLGYYNKKNELNLDSDWVVVDVPFVIKGKLEYGIDRCLTTLLSYGIIPSDIGIDILSLATLVYLADTRVSRVRDSQDSWTREFLLIVPVDNPDLWLSSRSLIERMLNFLTGDRWEVNFRKRDISIDEIIVNKEINKIQQKFDVVSLFSGGMDSLISTINILEAGQRPLLISHSGDGKTKNVQNNLLSRLYIQYRDLDPLQLSLWMVFGTDFIPESYKENTTRSRSFLFIALSAFAISGIKTDIIKVPENGLIALNVPLDNLRIGSFSTRTTHPYYLKLWNELLENLGLNKKVENDYWNKTKGEMIIQCKNIKLLKELLPLSMSCSSPGKVRWRGKSPQHCGYCVPCIIRRAAMNRASIDDRTSYSEPNVKELLGHHDSAMGSQIRSFQIAIARIKKNPKLAEFLIYKPGPLDNDSNIINGLIDVYKRGLLEVSEFIEDSTIQKEK